MGRCDDARVRRADQSMAAGRARHCGARAQGLNSGQLRLELGGGLIDEGGADEVLPGERQIAVVVEFGLGQICLGFADSRQTGRFRCAVLPVVEAGDQLPGLDGIAGTDREQQHPTLDLRRDDALPHGLHRRIGHVFTRGGRVADRRHAQRIRRADRQAQTREQQEGHYFHGLGPSGFSFIHYITT